MRAAFAVFLTLLLLTTAALTAKAELNAQVPEGKWKALRLRNLPKDAAIAVRVESSGPIQVIFLHQGRVAERAPIDEFFPRPASPEAAAFVKGELPWA